MSDRMLKRVWPHWQHPKSILGRGKASICLHYLLSCSLYMVVSCHFSSGLEQSGKTKENLILLSPLVLSFAGPPFFLHLTVQMGHDEDAALLVSHLLCRHYLHIVWSSLRFHLWRLHFEIYVVYLLSLPFLLKFVL